MSIPRALRRLLFWLISPPLVLLLILLLAAGFAISTETGLRGLLALAERVLPGRLSYDQVAGRLLGPLRIDGLRYEDGPLKLTLARGDLEWEPVDLLDGMLNIVSLRLDHLELQLPPGHESAPSTEPPTLPDIQLPLALDVVDLQAHAIRILPAGAEPIQVDAVVLKARTEAGALTLETLEAWAPQGEVRLSGRINPTGGYPLQARLGWQLLTPDYGTFNGEGEIQGELRDRLQLTQRITGPATLELNGEVRQPLAEPTWSVQAKLDAADLKPFVPELAGNPLAARIEARGVLARFEGRGEITATLPELGPATLKFAAAGDESSLKLDELWLTAANQPLALNAKGDLEFAEWRFNAAGQWQSLVWPPTGPPQVESVKGDFSVQGQIQDYRFQLTAELQGPAIPKGRWTVSGQGSDQAVREVKLKGETLEGVIEGAAEVAWAPAVKWQATLRGEGLNPGSQWKDVPGKLNLRLKSDGQLDGTALRADVLLEELAGTLSGQAVRGNADVAIQDWNLTIKTLKLNAGDARLEADGSLAQRWDLRWKLDAPQLQSLLPGLSGAIASSGTLSGPRDRPAVAANFTLQKLRHGDTQIQQLRGEANIDVSGARRSQLKVSGEGLALGGQNWKSLALDGSGTPAAHELKAELAGEPGRFLLALAGGLQTPSLLWQGRITQLGARDTLVGTWNLDQPAALRASAKMARLEVACLSSAPARLCLQGQWDQSGDFNGRVQLSNLTPDRFKHFLPQGMTLATSVGGEATVSGKVGDAPRGKLNLTIAPGSFSMTANGRPIRFALNGGGLQSDLNGRNLNTQIKLDLAQTGQLQARLQVQDPFGAAQINGKVNAALTDLGIVSLFVPRLQKVSGQLKADVGVAGPLAKLALRGEIRLENAGAAIPEAGITLQNLQLTAASNGQGPMQLSGSARSGPGQLQLSGEADPLKPQLSLSIKGQNFQALDTSDLRIQLSPDLELDIVQQQVRVEGELTIPQAFLRPGGNRSGAIRASNDVVIVNGRNGEEAPSRPRGFAIYARVRVVLGDDVQVETPVFKGKLAGSLLIEETPQLAPRGSGSIEVVAGNYRIFGEEVQIQRGQLLFSSSPLDNPGLNFRVVRQSQNNRDQITAGAQIRGTLKQPRMTLFSEPKMPDADILSYLVLGRSPQGGGSESALLFKAATALGLGGDTLTKGLGDTFGLDSLQLESGGSGKENTSLMLGRYLSPDLYVGYAVGLFNAVNTFNIRFRLSQRLTLESNSSAVGTGADLIYTIER